MKKYLYFILGAIFFTGISFAQSIPQLSPFFYDGSGNITQIKTNAPIKITGPTPGGCLTLTSGNIATTTGSPCGGSGSTPGGSSGQVQYNGSGSFAGVSTTTVSAGTNISFTPFTVIGSTPITLNATGGSGGSGTVSTSTVPTVENLAYWTSNGFPSLLGSVATGTISTLGGLTVTGSPYIIGANTTISCLVASGSNAGCLSASDWSTFNNKQAAGNYITALTGDVTASGPNSVAATLATVNSNVGTFTNATLTVNGKGLVTAVSTGSTASTTLLGDNNTFSGLNNFTKNLTFAYSSSTIYSTFQTSSTTVGNFGNINLTGVGKLNSALLAPFGPECASWDSSGNLTGTGTFCGTITGVNGSGGTTGLTLTGGASSGSVTLTAGGTLGVANGGTASTTLGGILAGNGTSAVKSVVIGSNLTFDGTTLAATSGGSGTVNSGTTNQMAYYTGSTAVSSSAFVTNNNAANYLGLGTSTPRFLLDLATSTKPQISLEDGSNSDQWSVRAVGGNLYFATTSATTFATSTVPAVSIQSNAGSPANFGIGTSSTFSILSVVRQFGSAPLFAVASSTVSGSNMPNVEVDAVGHIITSGPIPTVSGGTSSMGAKSNDTDGSITVVGTALTSVTMTFANAFATAPVCTESDNQTSVGSDITSISTTQVVFGFGVGGVTSATIWYHCESVQ